jgi:aminoglycoside phosphotransferase (APT) family kinase protein
MRIELLGDGYTNSTFRVALSPPVVVCIYRDARSLETERAALAAVRDVVPVPAVLHFGARFAILQYVDAVPFRQFKRTHDAATVARAARAVGRTLAHLAAIPADDGRSDADDLHRRFEDALRSPRLAERLDSDVIRRARSLVRASDLSALDRARCRIHGDFNNRNVLIDRDGDVAAIVDWECSRIGSPLFDIASFLQYEDPDRPIREPHVSEGYLEAGGVLPDGWRRTTRIINLVHQCHFLAEPDVPEHIVAEVRDLVVRGVAVSPSLFPVT